jgi:hypothetical protein
VERSCTRTRRELHTEKFKKVGKIESRGNCRLTSLWARMAEEGGREKLVSLTGTREIVINSAKVN